MMWYELTYLVWRDKINRIEMLEGHGGEMSKSIYTKYVISTKKPENG